MKVISFYSMKGGVGKTAASVNIAYLSAREGLRTLLIDLDPQGSSSYYFRIKPTLKHSSKTLLEGGKKILEQIRGSNYENLDLLPADMSYRNLDLALDDFKKSKTILNATLKPLKNDYDLVFLDCPPNITLVSENIFYASDWIFVPFIPTTLSMLTYQKLSTFFKDNDIRRRKMYAFFSMVERRKKLHRTIMEELPVGKKRFLQSFIPYGSDVERMGLTREPVCASKPNAPASKYFEALWEEIKGITS